VNEELVEFVQALRRHAIVALCLPKAQAVDRKVIPRDSEAKLSVSSHPFEQ